MGKDKKTLHAVRAVGVCSMGTRAGSICSWKTGVQRHGKQKENTSGKVNLQENVRWKSFSLFMWIRKNNPPSWTKSARANKLESRGRKQISKLTMAETSYFCRKGRGYWEHWNHRTIQLKFSYLYVCLDVLWRPQNSICCCCFSLNYCNWQY